jgi:hypothetical protein
MIKIFVNFRFNDTGKVAGRINGYLEQVFGDEDVFYYPEDPVQDIGEVIDRLRNADVLLVLIGQRWLEELETRQAQNGETDWVFEEIRIGLTTDGVLVIPVVVDDAIHPPVTMLPDAIKNLHYKRHEKLYTHTEEAFEQGMQTLVERIKRRHARFGGISGFYNSLPNDLLRDRARTARRHIRIMTIWTARWEFLSESLEVSLSTGARLDVLLLDPNNPITAQRDTDLRREQGYTARKIRENIDALRDFARQNPAIANRMTLRLFNAIPSRVLYFIDELVLIGTHTIHQLSADAPHILAFGETTPLYQNVWTHFERLWTAGAPHVYDIDLLG